MVNETSKKYNLKNDIVFKAFFARKGNEGFLIDFLNALLKINIEKISIKEEVNLEQLCVQEKGGRLDLQAELNDGIIVNIELQIRNEYNIEERNAVYSSKVRARDVERGTDYKDIKKVIMVNILDYELFEFKEYVSESITVLERHREYELKTDTKYIFIELPKFRKQNPNMENKLNQWLAVIDDTDRRRIEMAESKNKVLQKARVEINYIAGEASERRIAELREIWEMDRVSALGQARREGEARGEEKGIKKRNIEIAKEMLKQNCNIDLIVSVTGLTKEEIEKLNK